MPEERTSSAGPLILVGCVALLALGVLWFVSKRSEAIEGWQPREFVEYSPKRLRPGRAARPRTTVHYKNKERWKIKWNQDFLPVEFEIERNATRA